MDKVKCEQCGWKGLKDKLLVAKHPFDEEDEISGCPQCFDICNLDYVCEVDDCWDLATCGNTYKGEYKRLCSKHGEEE